MEQKQPQQFSLSNITPDEIDLKELAMILLSHWKLLIAGTLAGLLFGILICLRITPSYQSTALLQVNDQESSQSVLSSLAGGSMMHKASATQVQNALMHSRYVLGPVTEKLQLNIDITPHYFPILGKAIAHSHGSEKLNKPFLGLSQFAWGGEKLTISQLSMPIANPLLELSLKANSDESYDLFDKANQHLILSAKPGEKVVIHDPEYQGLSIQIDALRANKGTEFFITKTPTSAYSDKLSEKLSVVDQGSKYANSSSAETGVIQADLTWGNSEKAQLILNQIIETTKNKDIEKKSQQAEQSLKFISSQLPKIRSDLNQSEKQLNDYRSQSNILDISAESKIMLTQLVESQNALEALKLEKTQLQQSFTNKHPIIKAINDKIIKQQQTLSTLEGEAKQLPHSDQKALSLMREVKVKEELYSSLLSKIQELNVMQAGTTGDVRILNHATLPLTALPSHRSFILLSSIFAGGILVGLFIIGNHLIFNNELDPESVEELTNISVAAVVPHSREQMLSIKEAKKLNRKYPLLSQIHSSDPSIESLRSLKTSLQLHLAQARNNVITILGPSPSIGKSFVSLNFATVLAEAGQRVLVVDTDLRKGRSHNFTEGGRNVGLADFLKGDAPIDKIIRPFYKNCDIITCGEYPDNPTELLSSQKFSQLINAVKSQYNLVVLDTAPIMAVTDGLIVAKQSGTNYLMVGLGKNNAKEIVATIKRCQQNQIAVNALICNYFSQRAQTHAYSKYSYYAYSYGDKK